LFIVGPRSIDMLALSVLSTAFTLSGRFAHVDHHRGCAAMSSVKYTSNFEVTDALKAYADQKLGKPLETFGSLLNGDCELHLKVESRGLHDAEHRGKEAHIAEATAFCIDKHVINARSENEDMYASIDELTDTLTRSLRKYKEKRIDIKEERKRTSKETIGAEILEDDE